MSLENAIRELTDEIRNLQAALQQRGDAITALNAAADESEVVYITEAPAPSAPTTVTRPGLPTAAKEMLGLVDAGTDHDADDLPWDDRIHSGAKSKNANGTWKLKRGVSKDLVRHVRGELFAKQVAPSAPAPVQQTAPAPTQSPDQGHQVFAPVQQQQPPATAPTQAEPAMAYADVQARAADVSRILGAQAMKIQDLLSRFGVARLSSLQPGQYPAFVDGLNRLANGGEA